MKVIDLLNKIANGEEVPKKIKYDEHIYEYVNRADELYNYKRKDGKYLEEVWMLTNILNSEIEVIEDTPKEDKKIEYLYKYGGYVEDFKKNTNSEISRIIIKLNEIIDKVNGE